MRYVAASVVTNRQTDTHTHTQNDYCNPTPRVNKLDLSATTFWKHTIDTTQSH